MSVVRGTKAYWPALAAHWKKLAPPLRPSRGDIAVYKTFLRHAIRGIRRPRILVMGATPEMRDLVHTHRAEVTVADFSSEMIKAMAELMKYKKKTSEEVWVKGNWATLPLKAGYYDIILGDGVIDNVPWVSHQQWMRHTQKLLKPSGHFITREFDSGHDLERTLKNIIQSILRTFAQSRRAKAEDLTCLELVLVLMSVDRKRRVINALRSVDLLKHYGPRFGIGADKIDKVINELLRLYPLDEKEWRWHDLKRTEKELKPFFNLVDKKLVAVKFFTDITYIYDLKPRV